MVNETINKIAQELINRFHERVELILYYTHQFAGEGLAVIFKDIESFPVVIREVSEIVPPDISLHCLRRDAVRELERALPAIKTDVLNRIDAIRDQPEDALDLRELRDVLRESLVFVENLNEEILVKTKDSFRVYNLEAPGA